MSRTVDNLEKASAGESEANKRYTAFAGKADSEGFAQVAKLFRAAAEAETVHALNHLRIMGEIRSTLENMEISVSRETYEYSKMYPEYLKVAGEEGNRPAAWSFEVASKVEEIHAGLFSQAVKALEDSKDLALGEYYVCSVCGNTVEDEPLEKCPICNAPKTKFRRVV